MSDLEKNVLLYGRPDPLMEATTLTAGPVSLRYAGGDIRYVRLGDHEILRRVYAAVRDHNWDTITPRIHNERIEQDADSFRVTFDAVHVQGDVDFVWHGSISGEADGTVTFQFDGEARSSFKRNRIGFCVLHPTHLAGQSCVVRHVDEQEEDGQFPLYISPHQPIFDIRAITHEVTPGVQAEVLMEGDTFEMEDQRNWTDASYKTYCTPLRIPYPAQVEAGTEIHQAITVRLHGDIPPTSKPASKAEQTLRITDRSAPVPAIGLGMAGHDTELTEAEIAQLKALNLAHLRVDLRFDREDSWAFDLRQATEAARQLGIGLEMAVFLTDAADAELDGLRAAFDETRPPVMRWLIFHEGTTDAATLQLAREKLGDTGAPIGAGTDFFFTELNRQRPPAADADCISYSLNPQVHAFENVDLVETLPTQGDTVTSAQQFSAGKPVIVSPVTLKMRRNPNATGPQPEPDPDTLPPAVDVRQMSLFGAVWTLGSIKSLAESGAASVTYYETTGWRGVMETAQGSPLPGRFQSIPGAVFPLYHVLADVGDFAGGVVILSEPSDALTGNGLVLRQDGRTRILLANYTPDPQTIHLPDIKEAAQVRTLHADNAEAAMRDPEAFRQQPGTPVPATSDGLRIELTPYSVARVDVG